MDKQTMLYGPHNRKVVRNSTDPQLSNKRIGVVEDSIDHDQ